MPSDEAYIADLLTLLCAESRPAGSPRNAAIADDLTARYRAMGYDVEVDHHSFTGWELLEPPAAEYLSPVQRPLAGCLPVVWSGSTDGPVTGRVLAPGSTALPAEVLTFEEYPWDLFPVVDDAGAVVACLLSGEITWPQTRDDESDPTPYVMVDPREGRFIARHLARGDEVRVRLSVASRYLPDRTLRNVIAQARRRLPGVPRVIVAAHYDSFSCTPGAHDNASGTAALLCLARRLASAARPASAAAGEVTFASFDAEEWNKLGAYRHVEGLERSGRLAEVRGLINIDSVGVGEAIYLCVCPEHAPGLRRALRSAEDAGDVVAGGRPVVLHPDPSFRQFDTWPFMRKGVPAVQVGTVGPRPFSHWHQPGDGPHLIGARGCELIRDVVSLVDVLLARWASDATGRAG
jgi:hypothetical protein